MSKEKDVLARIINQFENFGGWPQITVAVPDGETSSGSSWIQGNVSDELRDIIEYARTILEEESPK